MKKRWALGVLAGLILTLFSLYPQMHLQHLRGNDWQGAFASCDLDEMAYASYLQGLIDGRPRRNDPYTGRDAAANAPQPESLFSIQFFPAYMVAVPARLLGLSASQMMPLVSAFSAFFTALALFWLIVSVTEDDFLALVGTLVVLTGSALIIGLGAVNGFQENGVAYPFFPFLRRYIPSAAFPFLFAFLACLWNGLKTERKRTRTMFSALASLCFATLVFSYLYVWTAAAAVLFNLILLTLLFRAENRRRDCVFLFVSGVLCLLALAPYALLLAARDETMDQAQLLVYTRRPDLLRGIAVIGYVVLTATALALWQRVLAPADRRTYLTAALALTPLAVLNQQVLTGRSLQPFHYEFYVVNYLVLLAIVLVVAAFWQKLFERQKTVSLALLSAIGIIAVFWGGIEARDTTAFWDSINIRRDEAMPVNQRLREIAGENIGNAQRTTTLNLEPLQADSQPTVAPQSVLWARHQHVFAGLRDWEENKRRYYQLLYYSDFDAQWLRESLTDCQNIEACMALFGWDRFNPRLSANARPLTTGEVEAEVKRFAEFSRKFSPADAADPLISYVIVFDESGDRLENFDLWFERDAGEKLNGYTLYRTKLKTK